MPYDGKPFIIVASCLLGGALLASPYIGGWGFGGVFIALLVLNRLFDRHAPPAVAVRGAKKERQENGKVGDAAGGR